MSRREHGGFYWALAMLLVCVIASSLIWSRGAIGQEQTAPSGAKIDAVLLIDTSGSMLATDPLKLRFEGAKLFLQFLDQDDRVALVTFSGDAKVLRALEPFDPSQATAMNEAIDGIKTEGAYTDIYQAIKTGQEILDGSPREDAQRIIILLSDGKMEPDPAVSLPMARTQELVSNLLPDLKAREMKIHTLAFSDQADRALLSEVSGASDGLNWFTSSANDIHKSFADLFLAVKRPQVVPLTSRGFKIDDDVQEATFYISREADSVLTMTNPNGEEISEAKHDENVQWFNGQNFDAITIEEPTPGDWQVHGVTSSDGFATVLTNLKLITEWPNTVRMGDPVVVQARLYEAEKPVALPEMSGVIKYAFQITPTDKVSEPIIRESLVDDATNGDRIERDGIFSRTVKLDEPGEYRLTVVARGPTFQRTQQLPFRVRPRLITLSVDVAGSEEHGSEHGSEHAGGHGDAGHGDADHAPPDEHGNGESEGGHDAHLSEEKDDEPKKSGITTGSGKAVFKVEISSEVVGYKKFEVTLTARDANRKRYSLPLKRSVENPLLYTFAASGLPGDGQYILEAALKGETKKRQEVEAESRPLKFERVSSKDEPSSEVKVIVGETPDAKPAPTSSFPLIPLLLALIGNAAIGAVAFLQTKKSQGGSAPAVAEYSPPAAVMDLVAELERRAAKSDVDLNDPIFAEALDNEPAAAEG